jgi:prepilin-type N-terminal cleavage/methylation domain-containing protein
MTPRRHAFTLIELLVVTAIMAVFFGIVIAGNRASRNDGNIRRGAQQFASTLLATQSLSLGSPTGAAVIISSDGTNTVYSQARRYPFIEGTLRSAERDGVDAFRVRLSVQNDDPAALIHGYRIRFLDRVGDTQGPPSTWFHFENKPIVRSTCHSCELNPDGTCLTCGEPCRVTVQASEYSNVALRSDNGQTSQNTLWPVSSGTLTYQTARYPIPAGLSHHMPKGVIVDLSLSGYGDPTEPHWGDLSQRGSIGIGFDTVGAMDAVMQDVLPTDHESRDIQPLAPHEPMYFFVTASPPQGMPPDTLPHPLTSEDAVWVVIQPRNGRVTVSPNVPQTEAEVSRDRLQALRAAREKARRGIGLGG